MRYYFHLESETNVYLDHQGQEFAHYEDMMQYAIALARELAEEDRWLGWSVHVIDAHNAEAVCLPVLDLIRQR